MNDFENSVGWRSPSNIALVKYWGKHGIQLPNNTSLSLTLENCFTETVVNFKPAKELSVDFYFEGEKKPAFAQKVEKFLVSLSHDLTFLKTLALEIHSKNSFPHSTGIASSASSMSALALCVCSIEEIVNGKKNTKTEFFERASEIARLGSGSASRSVYGAYTVWGEHETVEGSSNRFAVPLTEVHESLMGWKDAVLIVHASEKNFSSTQGHSMMSNNPYSAVRYQEANKNISLLTQAMKAGDVETFMQITEHEALTLHAMMMVSGEGYFEMRPGSLEIIQRIRKFRKETGLQVCFTMDAGPNVHVLYAPSADKEVNSFIEKELVPFCEGGQWIADGMGAGPVRL